MEGGEERGSEDVRDEVRAEGVDLRLGGDKVSGKACE